MYISENIYHAMSVSLYEFIHVNLSFYSFIPNQISLQKYELMGTTLQITS